MKKTIAAIVIVVVLGGFYFYYKMSGTPATPTAVTPTGSSAGSETTNPSASTGSTPPPTTTPTPAASAYKDGSYTGNVADALYGKVQVKATIKGGLITDVAFLKYPNDPGHTLQVSQQSMPILTQEAIKIQAANVDIVSGATQTSEAFQQSLGNALVQAKA